MARAGRTKGNDKCKFECRASETHTYRKGKITNATMRRWTTTTTMSVRVKVRVRTRPKRDAYRRACQTRDLQKQMTKQILTPWLFSHACVLLCAWRRRCTTFFCTHKSPVSCSGSSVDGDRLRRVVAKSHISCICGSFDKPVSPHIGFLHRTRTTTTATGSFQRRHRPSPLVLSLGSTTFQYHQDIALGECYGCYPFWLRY